MKTQTSDGKELLQLVGRRVLLKNGGSSDDTIIEAKVLEASPRGLVKLQFIGGFIKWEDPACYWLIETLNPLPLSPYDEPFKVTPEVAKIWQDAAAREKAQR